MQTGDVTNGYTADRFLMYTIMLRVLDHFQLRLSDVIPPDLREDDVVSHLCEECLIQIIQYSMILNLDVAPMNKEDYGYLASVFYDSAESNITVFEIIGFIQYLA